MRYFARISYDGSDFEGFQRLKYGRGVQNELERVLSVIGKEPIVVKGASRTDAFVHAYDQCIHFDFPFEMEPEKLKYVMNRMLRDSVAVKSIKKVETQFHARFDVKEKKYLYVLFLGEKDPFLRNHITMCYQNLDIKKMKRAAHLFLGKHDFRNFVSGSRNNYQSEIYSFHVKRYGEFLLFEVRGKSFYRYMVRSLVGALVDVGSGKITLEEISNSLTLKSMQRFSVLPPQGLYLMKITY